MNAHGEHLMADQIDSRAALWAAVQAIMVKEYGRENISQFSKKTKIPLATIGRIKSQTTSIGLEVVDRIADAFNLSGWQLLVPGFDPTNPPTLRMVNERERLMYEKLLRAAKELAASEPLPEYPTGEHKGS